MNKEKIDLLGLCVMSLCLSIFIYFTLGNCVGNSLDAYFLYIMFFSPFVMPIYEAFFKVKEVKEDA